MKKIALFLLIITSLALGGNVALAQSTEDIATIEVAQVDNTAYPNVTLFVRVLDRNGQRIPNLVADQFTVEEDGQPVELVGFNPVNASPIQTLMMLDVSGSMRENRKIDGAKKAALAFVDLMRSQDLVELLAFNENIYQLSGFTSDAESLRQEIDGLGANGGTSWYDAVIDASQQASGLSGRKSLLLLTDGLDEDSRYSYNEAVDAARASGASVYTIGLGPKGKYDEDRLQNIAEETGGAFYHAPSASELEALYRQIAQNTQDEYVLTYRSPRPDYDGTRRAIAVRVGHAGGSSGYVEKHLLTVKSNGWVAFALLFILGLALLFPLVGRAVVRRRRRQAPAPEATPPPPPAKTPVPGAQATNCAYCGHPLRAGARFCASCGKTVAAPAPISQADLPTIPAWPTECPNCGKPLRQGVKFCSSCGKRLT
jgi:Ca-activated chloride channel homolog